MKNKGHTTNFDCNPIFEIVSVLISTVSQEVFDKMIFFNSFGALIEGKQKIKQFEPPFFSPSIIIIQTLKNQKKKMAPKKKSFY